MPDQRTPQDPADSTTTGTTTGDRPGRGARRRARVLTGVVLAVVWLGVGAAVALALFLGSSRTTVVAGHDTVVSPTLDGYAVLHPGALLPDVRVDTGGRIGVDLQLGKTEVASTEELVERYAFIASQPDAQITKVTDLVTDMAVSAILRGLVAGAVPVGIYLLLGRDRRRQLLRASLGWRGGVVVVVVLAVGVGLVVQPWAGEDATTDEAQAEVSPWQTLGEFLGDQVPLPVEAADVEIRADVTTAQTRRLVESAVSTYEASQAFYADAAERAADLELRQPEDDETVAVMVSDRHDNIGMDPVARAIGDTGGATVVLDAGDDTSTGQPWEAFSLDSLDDAFNDYDERFAILGNHDQGDFVGDYLADKGWTRVTDGESMEGPGGGVLMGVDDPRSSGLGNWRDTVDLTFGEVRDLLTEAACDAEERVNTLLVHDASLGRDALAQGCVDLVIGGHIHVRSDPTLVEGENGEFGYSYTSGTTGGAAYAIAVGSKPRRPAETTLITYREGRPVGMQWVVLQTNGRFDVGEYVELDYTPSEEPGDTGELVPGDDDETPLAPEDTEDSSSDEETVPAG